MKSDKEIKKEFKVKASKDPDKYYPTEVLKKEGFSRKQCKGCNLFFWTTTDDEVCGDSTCSGGFRFFDNNPCKEKLSYLEVWKKFSSMFKKLGYTPIKRYPIVARWRADMDFVIASITDFQPYVVSGEVDPPANPLVVPQFCLRFVDIDNVGITGSHNTCFNMIGQHTFVPPEKWDQGKVFSDIKKWLNDGMGLDDSEIKFHEDAWAGGGNFGPCMEFFSRGVEIGNQVYMLYEQTNEGVKELKLKVLDMGMGMERCAWFSQGTPTIYDATFPEIVKKLKSATKVEYNKDLMKKYVPFSGMLNIDEVEDIDKAWEIVAKKVGTSVEQLKDEVLPMAAIYSIAEHARGLLIALSDGALPSNVGGGYNLRILVRRIFSFIDKFEWDIYLPDVCRWHAEDLKKVFPELMENLDEVEKILNVEKNKYENTKQKSKKIVEKIIKEDVDTKKLLELYDSHGIAPEIISEEAKKLGKIIKVPDNFFMLVTEMHEKKEQVHATKKEVEIDVEGMNETKAMYFDDWKKLKFDAAVLKVEDDYLILDKTSFYPTSGGQLHDVGKIDDVNVVEVIKSGNVILHKVEDASKFKLGQNIKGEVDLDRRKQLAQHHTATHIINAAARKVLGKHINQAGAKKTEEKAHIDLTHFETLTEDEIVNIEKEANKMVKQGIEVKKEFLSRNEAEKKFGMTIYQGGAVAGKIIRIVEIPEIDVECCGGTHLNNTKEVEDIEIIKSTKISDSIVRLEFAAGKAASKEKMREEGILKETAKILNVSAEEVPIRAEELFNEWKKMRKIVRKINKPDIILKLKSGEIRLIEIKNLPRGKIKGDYTALLAKTATIFNTQIEHVPKTAIRFLRDLEKFHKQIEKSLT
ncbi:alanine--tRNA ligase [Nanoarchaeota archaeon]